MLADPTQAKVKVKFEGKAECEPDDEISQNFVSTIYFIIEFFYYLVHLNNVSTALFYVKDNELDSEPQLQFGPREIHNVNVHTKNAIMSDRNAKPKSPGIKDDKSKDLGSLGYTVGEPIDWMRVQLPKKQDLFQEFYRRIHNYV